jgi:hypothetical protein
MSVTTTADEKLREAKEKLSEAYQALLIVLDENTWGHHNFKEGYIDTVYEVAIEILKLKRKL